MDQDGKAHNDRDAVLAADLRSENSKNVCVPLDDISALNVLLGVANCMEARPLLRPPIRLWPGDARHRPNVHPA